MSATWRPAVTEQIRGNHLADAWIAPNGIVRDCDYHAYHLIRSFRAAVFVFLCGGRRTFE